MIELLECIGVTIVNGKIISVPEGMPKPVKGFTLYEYYVHVRDWDLSNRKSSPIFHK